MQGKIGLTLEQLLLMVQWGRYKSPVLFSSVLASLLFGPVVIEENTPADTPQCVVLEAVLLVPAVLLLCLLCTVAQDWDSHCYSNGPQYCVIISERLHDWIKICW